MTNAAPTIALTRIAAVVATQTFQVSGTALDDAAVTRATWSLAGSPATEFTLRSDGNFTFIVPAPMVDQQTLVLEVRVSDGVNEVSTTMDVRVDRVGPTIELVAPAMGGAIGGATPRLTLRATDASGVLGSISIDGKLVPGVMNDTTFAGPVTVPANSARAPLTVVVNASDVHGNVSAQTFEVFGDTVAPLVAVTSPAVDDTVVSTSTLRLEGTASDPTTPLTVRVSGLDAGAIVATLDGGRWFADVAIPQVEAVETLSVEASDGLQSTTVARRIRIDRVAPQATIVVPARDTIVGATVTVTTNVTGTPASVEARLGTGTPVVLTGGPTSWTGQVTAPTLDFVPTELVITTRDAAGNEGTTRTTVVVDTVAPVITFTAPAADRKFNLADFASTNDVTVSWGVQDGDSQAAVTQVNGAANTATQLVVATSAADNGRVITTTVTARDRTGNTGTASRSFSVDRVRPTVATWTPAANTRNVEGGVTITFSEAVFGPTSSTDALTLTPAAAAGTWNTAHDTWTSSALAPYAIFTAELVASAMADSHGNALLTAETRRFSTAAAAIPGDYVLRSSAQSFRAVSDADGLLTVALKTSVGMPTLLVQPLSRGSMTLGPAIASLNDTISTYELNAWTEVDAVALTARPVLGTYWFDTCAGPSCLAVPETRRYENGASTFSALSGPFVMSVGPLQAEANRAEPATINGSSYIRGLASAVTLPFAPEPIVAQSRTSWAAFTSEVIRVRWTRYACSRSLNSTTCAPSNSSTTVSGTPSDLSVAMNLDGTCLAMSWTESGGRRALFVPQATFCSYPSVDPLCNGAPQPASVARTAGFSVAPFSTASGSGLLAAYQDTGGIRLARSNANSCDADAFTSVGLLQSQGVVSFQPVQVGQKPGLVYLTATNELRLFIP